MTHKQIILSRDQQADVRERLEELTKAHGGVLTPEVVVEDARNESSPLHKHFEWSEKKAAEAFRIEQARRLIREVKIQIVTESRRITTVAYIRNPDASAGEAGYVPTLSLRNNSDRAHVALVEEFARVRSALRRARDLAAVIGEEGAIDALLSEVASVSRRFEAPSTRQ